MSTDSIAGSWPTLFSPDRRVYLERLAMDTFGYFRDLTNPENGLVPDNTRQGAPCSIAATGLALACYPVAVERGWMTRHEAAERVRTTLRTFQDGPGGDFAAIGNRGFFYHFLDMATGRRVWQSELSTIDSTFVLAGGLVAAAYFDAAEEVESEVRRLADELYRRADWHWALDGGSAVSHGWKPDSGFLGPRWRGYNEALLLYALALGSPTYPVPAESYRAWTKTYRWRTLYGIEFLYAGPLFVHQLSHVFVDFRGIQDDFMRARGIDYFENSRRATFVQQAYAIHNPRGFRGYGEFVWGLSASDGPGPAEFTVDGRRRRFWDYVARGAPFGPDDGTVTPWAVVASLPFAPDIVLPAIEGIDERYPGMISEYGFRCSFNATYPSEPERDSWISKGYYGIDQGPIVLMVDNAMGGLTWELVKRCPPVVEGLRRAGFRGGWLDGSDGTRAGRDA